MATVPPNISFEHPRGNGLVDVAAPSKRISNAAAPTFSGTGVGSWEEASQAVAAPEPPWNIAISHSAFRLRALKTGWDGPGSVPISKQTLFRAETLVRNALEGHSGVSAPFLVPAGDGSVQIEWHELSGEIELSVDSDGSIYLWGRSHVSGHEFEREGEKALALFFRLAPRLASESNNASDVPPPRDAFAAIAA